MINVNISPEVSQKFPGVKIGYLCTYGVRTVETPESLEKVKRELEKTVRGELTLSAMMEDPALRSWNNLFIKSGLDVKIIQPAQEALIRRILKGRTIPRINNIVDCANIIAAKCKAPCGAFDLDRIEGSVWLRLSEEGENFLPLFSDKYEPMPAGEIVYADDQKIFSRYSKDSDITKITFKTTNVFFVIDGTPEVSAEQIIEFREELQNLVSEFCGGNSEEGYIEG